MLREIIRIIIEQCDIQDGSSCLLALPAPFLSKLLRPSASPKPNLQTRRSSTLSSRHTLSERHSVSTWGSCGRRGPSRRRCHRSLVLRTHSVRLGVSHHTTSSTSPFLSRQQDVSVSRCRAHSCLVPLVNLELSLHVLFSGSSPLLVLLGLFDLQSQSVRCQHTLGTTCNGSLRFASDLILFRVASRIDKLIHESRTADVVRQSLFFLSLEIHGDDCRIPDDGDLALARLVLQCQRHHLGPVSLPFERYAEFDYCCYSQCRCSLHRQTRQRANYLEDSRKPGS